MTEVAEIMNELACIVGQGHVKAQWEETAAYAVDHLIPRAVVFPKDTKQVSRVVEFANRRDLAVVPWGSGTKMSMGNPPKRVDLVVCTSRMNQMLDVDTANLTITVEAGVKFRDIQARLATEDDRCYLPLETLVTEADEFICSDRSKSGCFLPMDPPFGNEATIGGIVASNSSGPRRLLYNLPRDTILGVRLVNPAGAIVGSGGKTVKNVSGYDISKLMVGSMGSLGILCEMTFKLLPLPEKMETLLISFGSFSDASAFSECIFETSLLPAAVEVMNHKAYSHLNTEGIPDVSPDGYVSAIALEGVEQAVNRMRSEMLSMAKANGARSNASLEEVEHRSFWLRVSDLASTLANNFSCVIKARLNYPISDWKGIVESAEMILSRANLDHTIQVHAGSGICMTNLLVDRNDAESTDRAVEAMNILVARCREVEGNLVIQSAPAEVKGRLKIWGEIGSDFVVMKRIKEQIDPSGIMSPGRFIGGL